MLTCMSCVCACLIVHFADRSRGRVSLWRIPPLGAIMPARCACDDLVLRIVATATTTTTTTIGRPYGRSQ